MKLSNSQKKFLNKLMQGKADGLYYFMKRFDSPSRHKIHSDGKVLINFTTNDYLGLANHPEVKVAAIKAIKKFGVGTGQTRLFGTLTIHEELEEKLAAFINTDEVITFNSGFLANIGTIPALVEEGDTIIRDEYIHASVIDGCRMSRASILVFKHNDIENLGEKLHSVFTENNDKKILILTDTIFSMDGDLANLPYVCNLKEKFGASIMVDDSHATGILGENGGGAVEHFGLKGKVDLIMGSMGKALGGIGGFIGGNKDVITFLKHHVRSFIFTTSLPPPIAATTIKAIDIILRNPMPRIKLIKNAEFMRNELRRLGFDIGRSETQIIPIIIGDEMKMYKFVSHLFQAGIAVNPVVFPAVKSNEARIRMCITSMHSKGELEKTLEVLKEIGKKFNLI